MRTLIAIVLMLYPIFLKAQDDKINTDQPDQSTGASVLNKRSLQVESSLYLNHFNGEGTAVISSNLVRYGIFQKVEGRLLIEQGYRRDLYITEAAHATSPLAIGAKVELSEEKKIWPAFSVAAFLQLPVTNFNDQPHLWSPALVLIAEKKLSDLTITVNGGPKQAAFEHMWEWQSTADLKYDVSKTITLFGEYFGQFENHEAPLHNIDGGILYGLSRSVQLHLTGGSSIAHHPSNYFVTTGVAFNLKM